MKGPFIFLLTGKVFSMNKKRRINSINVSVVYGGAKLSREIYITDLDMSRLRELLNEALIEGLKGDSAFRDLERELEQAEIINCKELPGNVITMNSKVLIDLNGYEEEVSLVYPQNADLIENKISILSPIGTAMLGYSEGDTIKCDVPSGKMELQIKRILYQPESAGDYHL